MKEILIDRIQDQRSRVLIDNSPEAVIIVDVESGKFIDFNEKCLELLKISPEVLTALGPAEISPPLINGIDTESFAKEMIDQAVKGKNPHFTWVHLDTNGIEIPCSISLVKLPSQKHNLVKASITDLRPKIKIEENLKISEERLKLALEASGFGIYDLDLTSRNLYWNEKMYKIFGSPDDETMDLNAYFFSLLHPDDVNHVTHNFNNNLDPFFTGTRFEDSYRVIVNGHIKHIHTYGHIIRNADGTKERIIGTCQDISRQKKSEEKLIYHVRLLENVSDAVISADNNFKIRTVNKAAEKLYGWTASEVIGKPFNEVVSITYPDKTRDEVINEFRQHGSWKGKVIHRNRKGEELYIFSSVSALIDSNSQKFGAIAVNRDITDQYKTALKLRDSEARFRMAFNQKFQFMAILDPDGRILEINDLVADLQGIDKYKYKGQLFWESPVFANNSLVQEKIKVNINKARQIRKAVLTEDEYTNVDGQTRHVIASYCCAFDDKDNIKYILVEAVDITERKKGELELRQAKEQLSEITERFRKTTRGADIGIWEWDVLNDQVVWDETICEIYGIPYSYNSGHYNEFLQAVHEDDKESVKQAVKKTLNEGEKTGIEFKIFRPDHSVRHIKSSSVTQINRKGTVVKVLGTIQDITELKEAEQQKLRTRKLELKNKELEQFAYVASHDLQEPLRTVRGFVGLLKDGYRKNLDEKAGRYLDFIEESADRMSELINGLLEYSRIGHDKQRIKVDTHDLVQRILNDLNALIENSGAQINLGQLPTVDGYQTELRILFQNLISNAIKFRKENVPPEITIQAAKKENLWEFSISDNGIGIDEKHAEKIFILFQRLHTRSSYQGTGIGLAHCQKIIDIHGGEIWFQSKPGEGSTFFFTIPNLPNESRV